MIAAGGLEQCERALLLRSVLVAPEFCGQGLGQLIGRDLHLKVRSAYCRNNIAGITML